MFYKLDWEAWGVRVIVFPTSAKPMVEGVRRVQGGVGHSRNPILKLLSLQTIIMSSWPVSHQLCVVGGGYNLQLRKAFRQNYLIFGSVDCRCGESHYVESLFKVECKFLVFSHHWQLSVRSYKIIINVIEMEQGPINPFSSNRSTASSTPSPISSPESVRRHLTTSSLHGLGREHLHRRRRPDAIDNSSLLAPPSSSLQKIPSLTSEGGRLRRDVEEGRDFKVIPHSLWCALQQWYGSSTGLRRQVLLPL